MIDDQRALLVNVRGGEYVFQKERGDAEAVIVMRTGSEPATARSALRARFWLTVWGLAWAVFGTAAFALTGRIGWAVACGVLWLVITVDLTVILHRLRQGPHYQPGPDIPPYRPPDDHHRPP